MTVFKTKIFNDESRGASLIEVVLTISIIAVAAPFMYKQISNTRADIENISIAQKIVDIKDSALNFVRLHQDTWPDTAEITLTPNDIKEISPMIATGIIDKRQLRGTSVTDIYLAFDLSDSDTRSALIARNIGGDAAVVGPDGIAYADTWAVSSPDFKPGNLIYRISHNFAIQDRANFLHRAASDDTKNNLNAMLRDLNMGGKDIIGVGTVDAESATAKATNATFLISDDVYSDIVYFSSGANIQADNTNIDTMRVLGDISGFRTITANNLNGNSFSTVGAVITDSARIKKSIKIGNLLKLKSPTSKTINSFTAIAANSFYVPYVVTDEMMFYGDFGLTVSGELLLTRTAPLKIGNWVFPSNQMPLFVSLRLGRATVSATPNKNEFSAIMASDWQTRQSTVE